MPRTDYNIARQRTDRFTITINGLLTCRARLMAQGRKRDRPADQIRADIAAIDRVLVNVLGYQGDIQAVARDFKREALFRRGELFKAVCDVLRRADKPMTAREIASIVYGAKGKTLEPGPVSKQWIARVRKCCQRVPGAVMVRDSAGHMAWRL